MNTNASTLNARVGGVALILGAAALHALNQIEYSLQPIRLVIIGVLLMGAWCFADEMGLRKPLNRAGFICFVFSMVALAVTVFEPGVLTRKYYLVYSFGLLFSMLIWSMAYLHRPKKLKIAGAFGAFASTLSILVLIAGHISVGAGALLGVSVLLDPTSADAVLTSTPVRAIEAVFIVWCIGTAIFLWKGWMSQHAVRV